MTVNAGVTWGPSAAPVCDVDAAGQVDGDDRDPGLLDGVEHLRRVGPQRAGSGDPDHAVDHQIRCCGTLSTTRPPHLRERGQRLLMRALRLQQDRRHSCAATAQERRRPQRVTAVVAGADDRAHGLARSRCRARGRSRWPARTRPGASARRRAGTPAVALQRRGSDRRCSSSASDPRYVGISVTHDGFRTDRRTTGARTRRLEVSVRRHRRHVLWRHDDRRGCDGAGQRRRDGPRRGDLGARANRRRGSATRSRMCS